jgi:hypothetical protein
MEADKSGDSSARSTQFAVQSVVVDVGAILLVMFALASSGQVGYLGVRCRIRSGIISYSSSCCADCCCGAQRRLG